MKLLSIWIELRQRGGDGWNEKQINMCDSIMLFSVWVVLFRKLPKQCLPDGKPKKRKSDAIKMVMLLPTRRSSHCFVWPIFVQPVARLVKTRKITTIYRNISRSSNGFSWCGELFFRSVWRSASALVKLGNWDSVIQISVTVTLRNLTSFSIY